MYNRDKNVMAQVTKQGIDFKTLEPSDRPCNVCDRDTLLILGEGYAGRTRLICSHIKCLSQYSMSLA